MLWASQCGVEELATRRELLVKLPLITMKKHCDNGRTRR
jgi:hypothetical protein